MARKLKTYTTPAGFFELAVAAPSMKAALEAWGAGANLFRDGFATATEDPAIVASTMARPGVVLRRPVGSTGAFSEHAKLPENLASRVVRGEGRAAKRDGKVRGGKARDEKARGGARKLPAADDRAARAAARAFEREEKRRDSERRREEKARAQEQARRRRAVASAEARLAAARRKHDARLAAIDRERATLDRKAEAETARWREREGRLEQALRRARSKD
ncbi:cell envelope biogenesis protein TolA [Reyranella sp.]|uniref:cell envelope biogenesis protein TolA n=1 Tax=Reyranella sp. TaxID=1929291 RepID=UPI003BA9FDD0